MACHAYSGVLTNAPRRAAKRRRAKNSRWMHLGAAEIGTRHKIQGCWAVHTVAATNSLLLAGYAHQQPRPHLRSTALDRRRHTAVNTEVDDSRWLPDSSTTIE